LATPFRCKVSSKYRRKGLVELSPPIKGGKQSFNLLLGQGIGQKVSQWFLLLRCWYRGYSDVPNRVIRYWRAGLAIVDRNRSDLQCLEVQVVAESILEFDQGGPQVRTDPCLSLRFQLLRRLILGRRRTAERGTFTTRQEQHVIALDTAEVRHGPQHHAEGSWEALGLNAESLE
jgi:hypothetical protein